MTRHGEPLRWLRAAVERDTDECIAWPFSCRANGYGRLRFAGRADTAHRVALMLTSGPPDPGTEALHACHNPPCVNPQHLSWRTHAENMEQAIERFWSQPLPDLAAARKRRGGRG